MNNFLSTNEPIHTKNRRVLPRMSPMALFNHSFRSLEEELIHDEILLDPAEDQQQQVRRALDCRRKAIKNMDNAAFRGMKAQMNQSGHFTTGGAYAHLNQRMLRDISQSKTS